MLTEQQVVLESAPGTIAALPEKMKDWLKPSEQTKPRVFTRLYHLVDRC